MGGVQAPEPITMAQRDTYRFHFRTKHRYDKIFLACNVQRAAESLDRLHSAPNTTIHTDVKKPTGNLSKPATEKE